MLTLLGQAVLDGDSNRLANSGAVWVTIAFALGAVMSSDREAAVAGTATLELALVGYQLASSIAQLSLGASAFVIWTGTALVGGPVFGIAGRRWRAEAGRSGLVAIALLGAVFVAEGAYTLWTIPDLWRAGAVEVVLGIAVPVLLGRDRREAASCSGLALLAVLALLGLRSHTASSTGCSSSADRGLEARKARLTVAVPIRPNVPGHVDTMRTADTVTTASRSLGGCTMGGRSRMPKGWGAHAGSAG